MHVLNQSALLQIIVYLALAGRNDGPDDELAVMAESGIWPVCIPRDALQSSAIIIDIFSCNSVILTLRNTHKRNI